MPARNLLIALVLAGATLAAGGEPEAQPEQWSSPLQGLAVLIKAVNPEVSEFTGVPSEPAARLEFQLLVKNVSGAPLTLKVEPLNEAQMRWAIVSADGAAWTPLFAPAKAGGAGQSRKLELDEVLTYATIRGMVMFAPPGQAGPASRAMLPAGTYKVAAGNVRLPGLGGSFSTSPVTVRVRSADEPVGGLKLTLAAEKAETTLGPDGKAVVPVKLKLTFTNVGQAPLKLDLRDLAWASLVPDVEVSAGVAARIDAIKLPNRKSPPARAEDCPTLDPGKSYVFADLAFPGDCGRRRFARSGPAGPVTVRLRINYRPHAPAAGDKLAEGCWTGKVRSNEVSFSIR